MSSSRSSLVARGVLAVEVVVVAAEEAKEAKELPLRRSNGGCGTAAAVHEKDLHWPANALRRPIAGASCARSRRRDLLREAVAAPKVFRKGRIEELPTGT